MLHSSLLNGKPLCIPLHECLESFHILFHRLHSGSLIPGKNLVGQVSVQGLALLPAPHVGGQQRNAPGTAFTGCLHDRHRRVHGSCQDSLSHTLCLKETAVAQNTVHLHMLLLKQDIHAGLKGAQGCIQVYSHEICQVKPAVRHTHKQGTAFLKVCDVLS